MLTSIRRLACSARVSWKPLAPFAFTGWLISATLPAWSADLERAVSFDIPAQPLESALIAFGQQAHVQVVIAPYATRGINTVAVHSTLSAGAALTELLDASGLRYEEDGDTVTVLGGNAASASGGTHELAADQTPSSSAGVPVSSPRGIEQSDRTNGETSRAGARDRDLEEVVVTAQKRLERLQDVPVPVTAISADLLAESNELRLQDYFSKVPGLSLTTGDFDGAPVLAIRGVTTGGYTNPTVGITVDDVPYGSSATLGGGPEVPDIDPSELARVEVLRGPQGTLYGASSIGGLLKFVTVDPSTEQLSGKIQADINSVHNGDGDGYGVRGAANVPVSGTLAIRVSGFTRIDPGYIDDPVLHVSGVNRADAEGGHLAVLWRPSDMFTLKLSGFLQENKSYGSSLVNPDANLGALQQAYGASFVDLPAGLGGLQQIAVRGTGGYEKKIQAYSATLTGKFGHFELSAISGYSVNSLSDSLDFTPFLGAYTQFGLPGSGFAGFGVSGTPLVEHNKTTKFTQEVRLSAPLGPKVEWLLGVFYTHENNVFWDNILAADPSSGTVAGTWDYDTYPTTYDEYAAFTDVTVHFTERFDVQFGGRESQNKQRYTETIVGIYDPVLLGMTSPVINPQVNTKENSFTYLVTPRLKLTPELMVYARAASGYRPGGPNPTSTVFNLPSSYKPDTTENFEIGTKGDFLRHSLSVDASVYYIDWKDIQLQLADPRSGSTYFANASRAKSEGLELAVETRPATGLTVSAWIALNKAELTEGFPPESSASGATGDRLPYSSRFTGNVSLEQDFPITDRLTAYVGGELSYVGNREGVFATPADPQRQNYPAYAKTDVRVGGKYATWSVNLFCNNVTDKRGLLGGGLGTYTPLGFTVIQPRTVGVTVAKTF